MAAPDDVHKLAGLVCSQAKRVDREVTTLRQLAARLRDAAARTPHEEDTDAEEDRAREPVAAAV